jgi:predicted metallo-beta-lactamase superfamily hydrolase
MCALIETPDVQLLVDPGVSLSFRRGRMPHPREYAALAESRERIARAAARAEVVTISHYHFDHSTPTFDDPIYNYSTLDAARRIFADKLILAKQYRRRISPTQRRRGWLLRKALEGDSTEFRAADGQSYTFGETTVRFTEPVPHGETGTPLGGVLMLTLTHGDDRFVHASDVQGPIEDATLRRILEFSPNVVYVGGPPLYLVGYRVERRTVERGVANIARLVEAVPTVIVDHHLLRDARWRESLEPAFAVSQATGHSLLTAAEYLGQPNNLLESNREALYRDDPPTEVFLQWAKRAQRRKVDVKPPL